MSSMQARVVKGSPGEEAWLAARAAPLRVTAMHALRAIGMGGQRGDLRELALRHY
jgi:hypothetical protein